MNGDIAQDSLLLNRPMTRTGLPSGSMNINGDGSVTPIDYYVEALAGERLLVGLALVHVVDSGHFDSGSYGNGIVLANGMDVFYRRNGVNLTITDGLPIKTNVDWSRWCFYLKMSTFGQGNETLDSCWDLKKYGNQYGIILEEGDRIGIRVNDDMSSLIEQTVIIEGVHLGAPNPIWALVLPEI